MSDEAPERLTVEWELGHHCRIHGRSLGQGFKAEYIRADKIPWEEIESARLNQWFPLEHRELLGRILALKEQSSE